MYNIIYMYMFAEIPLSTGLGFLPKQNTSEATALASPYRPPRRSLASIELCSALRNGKAPENEVQNLAREAPHSSSSA